MLGRSTTLRILIIGVSHWHLAWYLEALAAMDNVRVVGVTDRDAAVAERCARSLDCQWSLEIDDICARVRPDLAVVLGRHCDMTAYATQLVDLGVPFVLEKPGGTDLGELVELAAKVDGAGGFAAAALVLRSGDWCSTIVRQFGAEPPLWGSMRFLGGPPYRYVEHGCAWMLDRELSGGGCLMNLGFPLVDLAIALFGGTPRTIAAVASNSVFGEPVEDYALMSLAVGEGHVTVEAGYVVPGGDADFDMRIELRSQTHYVTIRPSGSLEVVAPNGDRTQIPVVPGGPSRYFVFMADTVARLRAGTPPVAGIDELATTAGCVTAAYAMSL